MRKEDHLPNTSEHPAFDNFAAAKRAYNVDKNRFRDVLPYDRTRVRLSTYEAQPGSDYINANFVAVRQSLHAWLLRLSKHHSA